MGGEPHQQEVDLADDGIFEVVLALVVLKLDVQAVLDAHLHLQRAQAATASSALLTLANA
jgi:hypothetical protein